MYEISLRKKVLAFMSLLNGVYNNGVPVSIALNSTAAASFVTTIKYMLANGGTMIDEGYTHQYSNVDNPYDAVSGDDAEFYEPARLVHHIILDRPLVCPGHGDAAESGPEELRSRSCRR